MNQNWPQKESQVGAFTLVELLVASSVTMVLVALLLSVSNSILSHYSRSRSGTEYRIEAVRALDTIISDLETLLIPPAGTAQALKCNMEEVHDVSAPWLTFLAAPVIGSSGGASEGMVRAVSYRLAWQNPISGSSTSAQYGLYRKTLEGQPSFVSGLLVPDIQEDLWTNHDSRDPDDLLANHVIGFQIHFQQRADGKWISFADTAIASLGITRAGVSHGNIRIPEGISTIEVSLTVLSKQGAQLLRDGSITAEDAKLRFGETFTRRTSVLPFIGY